jgi:uncharacterized protein (DUF2344 family)
MTLLLLAKKEVYKIIKILENFCNLSKMEISIEKSAIIANHKNQTKFKIFGKELPQPEKYTYLGIIWSPYKYNWKKKQLESMLSKAKSKVKTISNITLKPLSIIKLINTTVAPIFTTNHSMEQRRNPKNGYSPQRNC